MILNGETYTVVKDKCREINNYGPDCRNGLYPIYVVCPIEFAEGLTEFCLMDLLCGDFLYRVKDEMSVSAEIVSNLFLLEISVPADELFKGTVHNSASEVYVTHKIKPSQLLRYYTVKYNNDIKSKYWYYLQVTMYSKTGQSLGTIDSEEVYIQHSKIFMK